MTINEVIKEFVKIMYCRTHSEINTILVHLREQVQSNVLSLGHTYCSVIDMIDMMLNMTKDDDGYYWCGVPEIYSTCERVIIFLRNA